MKDVRLTCDADCSVIRVDVLTQHGREKLTRGDRIMPAYQAAEFLRWCAANHLKVEQVSEGTADLPEEDSLKVWGYAV